MFNGDNVTVSVQVSDAAVNEVYDIWKAKGFPYYPTDYNWRKGEFAKMMRFDRSTLLKPKDKIVGSSAHGLSLSVELYATPLGDSMWYNENSYGDLE